MKRPEQQLQIECVKWFRMQYPHAIIHHSANGGYRTPVEGAMMKQMGVVAGFPDLMILHNGKVLFVEMKAGKGKLSDNQKKTHASLWVNDFDVRVIDNFDDFKRTADAFILESEKMQLI